MSTDDESLTDTATANLGSAMLAAVTPTYGADGEGTTELSDYEFKVDTDVSTGLTSGGEDVTLSVDSDGNVVGSAGGETVFTMSVDAQGEVTLTQHQVLDHDEQGDDTVYLASGAVSLEATATVTDGDGDTATETVSVDAGSVVSFSDDMPVITASLNNTGVSITNMGETEAGYENTLGYYLKDQDGNPTGEAYIIWPDVKQTVGETYHIADKTEDEVGLFVLPNGGTKNAALSSDTDVSLEENNDQWKLYDASGDLLKSSASGNAILFDVTQLNTSEFGSDQGYVIDNDVIGNLNWEDLYNGGDQDFDDINLNLMSDGKLIVEEDDIEHNAAVASYDFSSAFDVNAGADGQTALTFSLGIDGTQPTGLKDTVSGKDVQLKLSEGQVIGYIDSNEQDGASDDVPVFTLSVDSDTGVVTLEQLRSMEHSFDNNVWEGSHLNLPNNALYVTGSLEDGDGDVATTDLNIGEQLIFVDDVPSATGSEDTLTLDNSQFTNMVINGGFEDITGHQVAGSGSEGFNQDSDINNGQWVGMQSMEGWQLMGATSEWMEPHEHSHASVGVTDGDNYMDLGETNNTGDSDMENSHIGQLVGCVEEQDYALNFAFRDKAAIQANEDESGRMEVIWNGQVVAIVEGNADGEVVSDNDSLQVTGSDNGWFHVSLTVNGSDGDGSGRLEFKEIGEGNDNWGMALDSVSMTATDETLEGSIADNSGVSIDFGADGAGSVVFGELSGWTLSENGMTLSENNGNAVVTINNQGDYQIKQTGPLPEGQIAIPVIVTDGDGDTAQTEIPLKVENADVCELPENLTVQVTQSDVVEEGGTLIHKVELVDQNGEPVRVPAGEYVEVSLSYSPAANNGATQGDDYKPQETVRIYGGTSGVLVFNDTIDDAVFEGDEVYTVAVDTVGASDSDLASRISVSDQVVTGKIEDNDTTPIAHDDPSEAAYSVTLGNIDGANWNNADSTGNSVTITGFNNDGSAGIISYSENVEGIDGQEEGRNDNYELGVSGSPRDSNAWPAQQIEYDAETKSSEAISLQFNGNLNKATVGVQHLIGNESGGEVGKWVALYQGTEVAAGEFNSSSFDINTGDKVFDEVRFEALEYTNQGQPTGDSSDYFIDSFTGTGPASANTSYTTAEDETLSIDTSGGVITNDVDLEDHALHVFRVNGSEVGIGDEIELDSGALLTINSDGSFDYDPNGAFDDLDAGEVDTDTFTYAIKDEHGNWQEVSGEDPNNPDEDSVATATITIIGKGDEYVPNTPLPTAADDVISTNEDTAYTFSVTDFGDNTSTDEIQAIKLLSLPDNGSLEFNGLPVELNGNDGFVFDTNEVASLKFVPNHDTDENSSMTFQVQDNNGNWSNPDIIYTTDVNIAAVADNPALSFDVGEGTQKLMTTAHAYEGDGYESWQNNGNTQSSQAQSEYLTDQGYGVSNKNGNNGNQTTAIEENESLRIDLPSGATKARFEVNGTVHEGIYIAYDSDRNIISGPTTLSQGIVTIDGGGEEIAHIVFDAHSSTGNKNDGDAFYIEPKDYETVSGNTSSLLQYEYPLQINVALMDTDNSETIVSEAKISGLPEGAFLMQGDSAISITNGEATVDISSQDSIKLSTDNELSSDEIAALRVTASSIEGDNGDLASTIVGTDDDSDLYIYGDENEADVFAIPSSEENVILEGFDAAEDTLDLSEVIDMDADDTLDEYLSVESDNGSSTIDIDSDKDGQTDTTVKVDTVIDPDNSINIQVDDENIDFTDQ
ncbi:MAG: DUF5801 repeats-in-toxin domain-containing protein [Hydrogenovibrio sp.]|uniref:DUF5801 repeats-in-toxin domain-containing protein n=1 Tax=Hydrogenovibrio sp. TaxID=2065821 RepID=UPI0028707833|nr:DUF5801 repeats-in-toxin domain-containing protein [Hydrogenovibrio sp.]MDR9498272.1 DUF5801 repeats-in-toxin domain-containing protein [Hydrogenovibrio sp.]